MNRRFTAAGCLAASPVLVSLSHFLWPAHSESSDREQIAAAGAHSAAWAAATLVETIGWLLLVPAFVIAWGEVRGRGRTLTTAGVWLSVAGVFGYYGAGTMNLITIELGRQHHDVAMAGLMHAFKHDAGLFWLLVAPLLIGTVAFAVAFAGFARAGLIGWWAPIAAFAALVASQLLSGSDNAVLLAAAYLPMTAASFGLARQLAAPARASRPQPAPVLAGAA
jgi:hypothetical protein